MPFPGIQQPEVIQLTEELRLKQYDGHFEKALPGYQDPVVYQNSEGIFDESKIPGLDYVKAMCEYLDQNGELYFIEAREDGAWTPVGDVTVKPENPPIAIWYGKYRGRGLGKLAMRAVIRRLGELGYPKITGTTVYKWNPASLALHRRLGFSIIRETDTEYYLERDLKEEAENMEEIRLNTSQLPEMAAKLRAGQRVLLSGRAYTSRDAAHKRIVELLDRGEEPPFPLAGAAVYYAGPTPAPDGMAIGSCGPTTSVRMDPYTPRLLDLGLRCMIGKGRRSAPVVEAMKRNGAVYLCAIGGAGALAAQCITQCRVIAFEDLGCETVKALTLKDFPLIVGIDSLGGSILV